MLTTAQGMVRSLLTKGFCIANRRLLTGYGHATRVSAVASHLRQAQDSLAVHIVSSAPKHVFEQAISHGSSYRYAEIDPVIVQPLA